jgi:hypothetical protein
MSLPGGRRIQHARRTEELAWRALDELFATTAISDDANVQPVGRRHLPPAARFAVLERDGFRCRYCGNTAAHSRLTVDHVLSVRNGGSDDPSNLVTACIDCNRAKQSASVDPSLIPALE